MNYRPEPFAAPQPESYTTWHNPLSTPQIVDLSMDGGIRKTRFVIPPGGEERIPSRFDRSVQVVHHGVVIGGLAPQLVNVSKDGPPPKVLEALDTEGERLRQAELAAAKAAADAQRAEETRIIAEARADKARAKPKAD